MAKKERKFEEVKNDLPPVWGGEAGPKEGDVLEGIYVAHKDIKFRNKPFRTYQIQNEDDGTILSFSGAIADQKMMLIRKGTYLRITFVGMMETNNGEAKDYKIERDEKSKLLTEEEVSSAAPAQAAQ